jgi:OOP family OmpA-OmpF porin
MQKKLITAAVVLAALMSGCATQPTPVFEPFQVQDLNPLLASGLYAQKTDNFFVINDSSSSMRDNYLSVGYAGQPDPTKFSVEKEILSRINQSIPDFKAPLTSSIRSFGFGPCLDGHFTKLNQEPTAYSKATFSSGLDALECASGGSPLDDGIVGSTQDLSGTTGRISVLILSDGHDLDSYGTREITALKEQYADRQLCVYGVWAGNPEEISGLAVLNQLSSIAGCGFAVSAEAISTSEGLGKFVKAIFLKPLGCPEAGPEICNPPPCPDGSRQQPCPVEIPVHFKNDKSDERFSDLSINLNQRDDGIDSNTADVKRLVAQMVDTVIKTHPDTQFKITGHTSYTGTRKRNEELGRERAIVIDHYLRTTYPEIANQLVKPKNYVWNCPEPGTRPSDDTNRRSELQSADHQCANPISDAQLLKDFGRPHLGSGSSHNHTKHPKRHH